MVELNFCSCGKIHVPKKIRDAVKRGERVTANILPRTSGIAKNVLKWGTGGLNIDGSRISVAESEKAKYQAEWDRMQSGSKGSTTYVKQDAGYDLSVHKPAGRFPSHLVLSHSPYCEDAQCDIECAIWGLDQQSGVSKSVGGSRGAGGQNGRYSKIAAQPEVKPGFGDSGGASRFFYCAKISSSERNAGLEGMPGKATGHKANRRCTDCGKQESSGSPCRCEDPQWEVVPLQPQANHHPTVKPQKLMRYLINLVTPPNGLVLDPFAGSGSTGVAAKALGFNFLGIEQNPEYVAIAEKRIEACQTA